MPQISQPFSFPGPTRRGHRKRNLGGLAALVRTRRQSCIDTDAGFSLIFGGRDRLCVRRDRARQQDQVVGIISIGDVVKHRLQEMERKSPRHCVTISKQREALV